MDTGSTPVTSTSKPGYARFFLFFLISDTMYEIITSDDGSHSLQIKNSETTFHSRRGAIQESRHVFIDAGLRYFKAAHPSAKSIKIFEAGFGTGLNALLTAIAALELKTSIEYHSIERHPLPGSLFFKLNYADALNAFELYKAITQTGWNQLVFITPFFKINKIHADLTAFSFHEKFDIIYFDAFAPNDQPELWTEMMFSKIFEALNPGGVLVTYCSRSSVQKALKNAGFVVEKLVGPPGKREMVRAIKKVET